VAHDRRRFDRPVCDRRGVTPPLQLRFVLSADRVGQLPPTQAEVAVVGRSNVGKSSLLNAVANRTQLAKVSKTPGRTQKLNLFELEPGRTVLDCPGYGFAKAPGHVRQSWAPMIEGYLEGREGLAMVCVLVDGEIGPTKLDVQMLDYVQAIGAPHTVIATKQDKVKASKRDQRKIDLAQACGLMKGDVVWVSATKNVNIDHLRDRFLLWLGKSRT
jgi:GTP-binding protein